MALTLITGEPGAGKTGILYDVIRRESGGVPVLLLPSVPDVARARVDLVRDKGLAGANIVQIDVFLATLWELHGDGRRLITALQRSAFLRAVAAAGILHEVTDSANTPGFLVLLERLVALQWSTPKVRGPKDLGRAIAETAKSYQEALQSHGLIELSQATSVLADRVDVSWFDGPVLANRFDDLTGPQERFLIQAASAGVDVHLAVAGYTGSRMVEATSDLIQRLEQAADSHVTPRSDRDCSAELAALERTLLVSQGGVGSSGDVRLSIAMGEEAEAERIAAEILDAASRGIPFGEMAVIYRETCRHHAALRRAFDRAGVPADFDLRVHFGETAFGRAVLALLEFGTTGSRSSLTAFLSSGYAGIRREDVDELDALWRRQPDISADEMVRDLERISSDTRRFVARATRLAAQGVTVTTAAAWKDLAGDLMAHSHGREAPTLGDKVYVDAQAHRKLCQAVDDIGLVGDMGLEQSGIRQVLSEARIALGGSGAVGRVQVMDVERVRGRSFDFVVIAGLTAGEFPRALDAGVYESEELRTRLKAQDIQIPRDGGLEAERLLFFMALTRARRVLVLSRQISDSDGRPLRPSILLEEVVAAYSDAQRLPERGLAFHDLGHHQDAPTSSRRALRTIALCAPANDPAPVIRARARYSKSPGIADPSVRAELSERTVFSATELETYLACPYKWFYTRYLRPESLDGEGEQLTKGRLAHGILAQFYDRLSSQGIDRVTSRNVDTCLALCESILQVTIATQIQTDGLAARMLAHELNRDVLRLVRRDAEFLPGFAPHLIEWPFGLDEDTPQEFNGFSLKGRIDRVDSGAGGLVVIDYKSGKAIKGSHFETDGVLQAPLYAAVVQHRTGKSVVGTFYRSLSATQKCDMSRGIFDSEHVSGPELTSTDAKISLDEAIAGAMESARRAAAGIRSGAIPREPLNASACIFCGARTWCEETVG